MKKHAPGPWGGYYTYTLPNGRRATTREQRERERLLEARERCQECSAAADRAVRESDYRPGACQCPEHRS